MIHGTSPMPREVMKPPASCIRSATPFTWAQKRLSLPGRMVARVSTAMRPSYPVCFGRGPKQFLPSHVPWPSIGTSLISQVSQEKNFHQLYSVCGKRVSASGSPFQTAKTAHWRQSGVLSNVPFFPLPISFQKLIFLLSSRGSLNTAIDKKPAQPNQRGYRTTVSVQIITENKKTGLQESVIKTGVHKAGCKTGSARFFLTILIPFLRALIRLL